MATSEKAAGKRTARKQAGNKQLSNETLRIRMYRVGFGDCFLVSLPVAGGHRHILVDCGVHPQGDIKTMEDVVENIMAVTDRKIAVVIATHVHQDHVSGFAKFGDTFRSFEVGEVWLPWTEDLNDSQAVRVQKKHLALAEQLQRHFAMQAVSTASRAAAMEAIANLVGNQKALELLRSGFESGAEVRYLDSESKLKDPAEIEGLAVRVLGPPRDEKFLAKMNPPSGQRYLKGLGPEGTEEFENALIPFPERWKIDFDAPELENVRLSKDEMTRLKGELADASLESLAFALDHVRNNTSLVTLFDFRGRYLLFPGDAQYGSWRWWLDNENSEEILSRLSFLKVAHHGSHNATPRDALEGITGEFTAMVSTQSKPWESIPRIPLMERIDELTKGRLVRSDSLTIPDHPDAPKGPAISKLPKGFVKGDFWYDYLVRL